MDIYVFFVNSGVNCTDGHWIFNCTVTCQVYGWTLDISFYVHLSIEKMGIDVLLYIQVSIVQMNIGCFIVHQLSIVQMNM